MVQRIWTMGSKVGVPLGTWTRWFDVGPSIGVVLPFFPYDCAMPKLSRGRIEGLDAIS